ncbi:MAG: F0F1 ATP synthase subunit A [Nitrospinae bacterium]|nr:F0F1 ATP synthase subunit A [Nitrospinota bacterium]
MRGMEFWPRTLFEFAGVEVTETVTTTWLVMILLAAASYAVSRRLSLAPSLIQEVVEALVESIKTLVEDVLDVDAWEVIPFLGTLWIFIGAANLVGLVPGLESPTADVNTTFAFAFVSYLSVHYFGVRFQGVRGYLKHYSYPTVLLLPVHLMADLARTVALSIRLFGNMLSGEMIAAILLAIVGLIVPVAMMLLHVLISIVQAYIFGALTLAFIAGGQVK